MKHPLQFLRSAMPTCLALALVLVLYGCTGSAPRITLHFDQKVDTIGYLFASLAEQTQANAPKEARSGQVAGEADGSFTIELPDDEQTYLVWIYRNGVPALSSRHFLRLYLFPAERVHLEVRVDSKTGMMDYTATGSAVFEAETVHRRENYERLELELESLGLAYGVIQNEGTKGRVREELDRLGDSIEGIKLDYITMHPDAPLSGYYVATLRNPYLIDSLYHHVLGDSLKAGNLRELLDRSLGAAQRAVQADQEAQVAQTGRDTMLNND